MIYFSPIAMKIADIIIPRGGGNLVAIDLIVRQIKNQLAERGEIIQYVSQLQKIHLASD
jgi:uridine kinase